MNGIVVGNDSVICSDLRRSGGYNNFITYALIIHLIIPVFYPLTNHLDLCRGKSRA